MAKAPLITIKAGICDFDASSHPPRIKSKSISGYLYLFEEDDLVHFCWRPRTVSLTQPELDLTMVPGDGTFTPYESSHSGSSKSPTNGRVFALKFQSSTQRYLFWLQSKSQHPQNDPAWFSPRDLKLGQVIDRLLQGDTVNVAEEVASLANNQGGNGDDDHEAPSPMEDLRSDARPPAPASFSDGAQNESHGSGDGGNHGGRSQAMSSNEAMVAVQNFLKSMKGRNSLEDRFLQSPTDGPITLLDLLPPATAIPVIDTADESFIDSLLSQLPPELLSSSHQINTGIVPEASAETVSAGPGAWTFDQKKAILKKVLRSPQFSQSLIGLTGALRDGGLPAISDALGIQTARGGYANPGGLPMGNDAMKAFVEGIRTEVERDLAGELQKTLDS